MKKILVIGGGFAGCASCHALNLSGDYEITLLEASGALGAGVRTYFWGGHPYTYGPRHFLTKDKNLFDFLNKYIPMRDCSEHKYLSYVENDDQFYSMPLSYDDIKVMPDKEKIQKELDERKNDAGKAANLEDFWIKSVGQTLYEKSVKNYNKKMWMVNDNTIFKSFGWSTKGDVIKKGKEKRLIKKQFLVIP